MYCWSYRLKNNMIGSISSTIIINPRRLTSTRIKFTMIFLKPRRLKRRLGYYRWCTPEERGVFRFYPNRRKSMRVDCKMMIIIIMIIIIMINIIIIFMKRYPNRRKSMRDDAGDDYHDYHDYHYHHHHHHQPPPKED